MSKIKDFFTISRIKILIATPAQPLLGIFLAAFSFLDLNLYLIQFMILYFLSIIYACNVNCYCDRDLDIKYKVHLAEAVDNLGKPTIRVILIIESILIMIFSIYLMFVGYMAVGIIAIIGWGISTGYSALPIRIKKRGYLSAFPIIIGLFTFPFINGWLMITNYFTVFGIIFLIGYILMNQGFNLINTAEDYDEDLSENVRTWAHIFGLKKTFLVSLLFTIVGGICCIIAIYMKLILITIYTYNLIFSSSFLVLSATFIFKASIEIYKIGKKENLQKAAKDNASKMPFWFASTRYPMLIAVICMLIPY